MKLAVVLFLLLTASGKAQPQLIEKGPVDPRPEIVRKNLQQLPERGAVSVAITLQPKEVFEAAFLEIIPGVAMFDALVCNNTDRGLKISGGKVLQAVHPRVEPISPQLYALTVLRGKQTNWRYKTARVAEWAAFGATLLFTSGVVTVGSDLLRVLPPLVMDGSRRLAKEWQTRGLDPAALTTRFLTAETELILDARQCRSLPLLGRYRGQTKPFEVDIQ